MQYSTPTLYIANKNYSSWSLRPWVLMRELNIAFDEHNVVFAGHDNYSAFKSFAPNAQVPCLHHDDLVVWESLAICEYLAEHYPQVWPKDKSARAWARSSAAEMHAGFSALRNICGMSVGIRVKLHEVSAKLQKDLDRLDELWTEGLEKFNGPFLAGENFTAVDAFYAPVTFRVQTFDLQLSDAAKQYCSRILALDSMQDWYAQALLETSRDPDHENETEQYGTVIADYRAL